MRAEQCAQGLRRRHARGLARRTRPRRREAAVRLPADADREARRGLDVALSDGEAIEADQVLVATGRRPNTKGLGLESAGVALDAVGAVVVDRVSTSNIPSIHAVGDVTNRINLTPVAIREGHALADRLFGGGEGIVDHDNVAHAVFATPEIGSVGLTEAEAVERYEVVDIYKTNFRPMKATLSGSEERTIMKLVVDAASDRVVGAHILGHEAGEMIQVLAIADQDGRDKGRSRRDDGGPSDRGGGTGDDAHARRADRTRKERRRSPVGGGAKPWLARLPAEPSMILRILTSSAPANSMKARTRAEWRRSAWVRIHRSTSSSGCGAPMRVELGALVADESTAGSRRRRRPPSPRPCPSTELTRHT